MISMLSSLLLAQATPAPPPPQEILRPQVVRALPGSLDSVLVFNSNSPEVVQTEGILLSSFPPIGKQTPTAHLNFPFQGRFDLFAHHIAKARTPEDLRTLYFGVLLHNPGTQTVRVDILQAASYLSQPDAPFIDLPTRVENPLGTVYAGPGSRAMNEVLRGLRQPDFPSQIEIPPGEFRLLMNLPIPVKPFTPPLNGRSSLIRLWSSGAIYLASLAMFAKPDADGAERAPSLAEWQTLLETGTLAAPRDRPATPPEQKGGVFAYGRVAGIARGSRWKAMIVDPQATPRNWTLSIPAAGETISYGLSTLIRGRLGTGQDQTVALLARYPDTAYRTHGNYAIEYNLTLPLKNATGATQTVTLALETPIKEDVLSKNGLRFFSPLPRNVFFRGTVRIRYTDDRGFPQTRYLHLVQRRGQAGDPLAVMTMPAGDRRLVQVDFLYPPDSTPPQVLTLSSAASP